jgi:type VI secretion system protein VasL
VKWVYVVHQENQPNGEDRTTAPVSVRQWKPFLPGCVPRWWFIAVAWGWAFFVQTRPLATQAFASLAPLPEVLTPVQQDALTLRGTLPSTFITDTQQQLARLDKLPPDWNISYSLQLLKQLQTLWPEEAKPLTMQWQQNLTRQRCLSTQ